MNLENGEKKQITDFELGVSSPLVSPDNNYIAFTAEVYPEAGADGKKNLELIMKKNKVPYRHILPTNSSIVIGPLTQMVVTST